MASVFTGFGAPHGAVPRPCGERICRRMSGLPLRSEMRGAELTPMTERVVVYENEP